MHKYVHKSNLVQLPIDKFITVIYYTYTKTSFPYPAMAVKSLGAKSLAGLIAYPQLNPKDSPMPHRRNPIIRGFRPAFTSEFLESQIANIPNTSKKVPKTCEQQIVAIKLFMGNRADLGILVIVSAS